MNPDNSVLGTYTSSGVCNDSGTIFGAVVPSIAGAWSGVLSGTDLGTGAQQKVTVSATIAQAAAPSSSSTVPAEALSLSGTVTAANTNCIGSAPVALTIDPAQSYVTGDEVAILAVSDDQQTQLGWFANLSDPTSAASMIYSSFYGSNPYIQTAGCFLQLATSASLTKN